MPSMAFALRAALPPKFDPVEFVAGMIFYNQFTQLSCYGND